MSQSYKRRYSPGLTRADNLYDDARAVQLRAREQGHGEADRLADLALSCAFNSRSGYEASQGLGGGSSPAFSLRKEGARWLAKGRKHLAAAKAALSTEGNEP